jgi:hypothetical protein
LFDTSAKLYAEITQPKDEDGQARYSHLPLVDVPKLLQAPSQIPPLFAFSRTSVYLLMSPSTTQKTPKSVVLRGTSTHGPLELEIPIQVLEEPGETIHQLAAKKAVGELEEGRGWLLNAKDNKGSRLKDQFPGRFDEIVEREAVRLGVQFQVGGKFCSFVAVEKKEKSKDAEGDALMSEKEYDFLDVDTDAITLDEGEQTNLVNQRCVELHGRSESSILRGGFSGFGRLASSVVGGSPRCRRTNEPARKSTGGMAPRKQLASMAARMSAPRSLPASNSSDRVDSKSFGSPSFANKPSEHSESFASDSTMHYQSAPRKPTKLSSSPRVATGFFGLTSASAAPAPLASTGAMGGFPASSPLMRSAVNAYAPATSSHRPHAQTVAEKEEESDDDMGFSLYGDEDTPAPAPAFAPPPPPSAGAWASAPKKRKGSSVFTRGNPPLTLTMDPLQALIETQTFEGFWEWTRELCTVLGVDKTAVESKVTGFDTKVLATALAVHYFEAKLSKDKDSWEMIVEKAKGWLESMGHDEDDAIWKLIGGVVA